MTIKYLLIIAIISSHVMAIHTNVSLSAKKFSQENNKTTAFGDVVFNSTKYKIQADKIEYNQETTKMEFFDNVQIDIKEEDNHLKAKYLKAVLKDDYLILKQSTLKNEKSKLWMESACIKKQSNVYELNNTLISACSNKENPFWKIKFSNGTYNQSQENMSLTKAIFYIKSIPVFYMPYLNLNIGDQPRSGFLAPQLSIFGDRAYMQPIYFSIKKNIDLEVRPYIKENQGQGTYAKLRFIDSNNSQGSLNVGAFKTSNDSFLVGDGFYGIEFNYIKEIQKTQDKTSLLFMDMGFFDNPAYLHFKTLDNLDSKIDATYNSKIEYIYKNKEWSIETQIKDVKDVKTNSHIQLLPVIKAQKTRTFINDKLSYKFEYKIEHRNMKDLLNPLYQEAVLPHYYNMSLFNGFVNINLANELKLTKQDFYKDTKSIQSEHSIQDYANVQISSTLAKKYKDITHNIDINLYSKTLIEDITSQNFILPQEDKDKIGLNIKQHFIKNGKSFLSHSISQEIYQDKNNKDISSLGDTTSYLAYKNDNINLYNKSSYSIKNNKISYLSTGLDVKNENTKLSISHLLQDEEENKKENVSNYIGAILESKVSQNIKLAFDIEFDQKNKQTQKWTSSIEYTKDCWGYTLKVGKNNIPTSNIYSLNTQKNNLIYFQIKFNPIGGLSHNYYF